MLNTAFGNSYLAEYAGSPAQFPSESAEMVRQHSDQQCFRNLIRARDTVLVSSEPDGFWLVDLYLLRNLTVELRDLLLVVIFARDYTTRLALSAAN